MCNGSFCYKTGQLIDLKLNSNTLAGLYRRSLETNTNINTNTNNIVNLDLNGTCDNYIVNTYTLSKHILSKKLPIHIIYKILNFDFLLHIRRHERSEINDECATCRKNNIDKFFGLISDDIVNKHMLECYKKNMKKKYLNEINTTLLLIGDSLLRNVYVSQDINDIITYTNSIDDFVMFINNKYESIFINMGYNTYPEIDMTHYNFIDSNGANFTIRGSSIPKSPNHVILPILKTIYPDIIIDKINDELMISLYGVCDNDYPYMNNNPKTQKTNISRCTRKTKSNKFGLSKTSVIVMRIEPDEDDSSFEDE
jgi:hypothetical protein